MDIITADLGTARNDTACDHLSSTNEIGFIQSARLEDLNVETVTSNPALPTDRRWAIRFKAGRTVVLVLGMRDYGKGCFSAYFAGLVTARLGVPFRRIRIYYSATLPAVLRAPLPSLIVFHRSHIGPVASAVADIIDGMCDQVIERGRAAFAAMAGVDTVDVGFDQPTGRFFILDRDRSGSILEIAETVRGGSPVPTVFARNRQESVQRSIVS
ncbi:MAG TPA: hypothetical protein VE397_00980 [Stellaceae bacterium]|nr:hypothetical protein [Stellaceae bacterium]